MNINISILKHEEHQSIKKCKYVILKYWRVTSNKWFHETSMVNSVH